MSNTRKMFSAQAAKAYVAAIVAGIAAATLAAPDGINLTEGLTIAGAFVVAFQGTFWTSNAPSTTPPAGEEASA